MGKGGDVVKNKCPFASAPGYSTRDSRQEYVDLMYKKQKINADNDSSEPIKPPTSLEADLDTIKPLYFWQLHSLIGRQPVLDICRDFYDFVYMDFEAPWFRKVFEEVAPKQHHIMAQAGYWVDAMGGGRVYHGGLGRLNYHHYYNADPIMNAKGAKRWMHHMRRSIRKNYHHFESLEDPRILPCIVMFLETKMRSYAEVHGWEFDESDFKIEDFYPKKEGEKLSAFEEEIKGLGDKFRVSLGSVPEDSGE